ncbi:MAG TPA: hypothetical protein VJ598_09905 [Albitalea sp.]|nr:hypothetical protein [Albitalea sp.]
MFTKLWLAALLAWSLATPSLAAPVLDVVYPRVEERSTEDYGYAVLELALAKSGVPYKLRLSEGVMTPERARLEIEAGRVSVLDFGSSADYETRFRAVYFPIDRGLSGYRLAIIHRDSAADFARIRTLAGLRQKSAGQGPGWADATILADAGIRIETAQFEQLFRMVNARRFDFYPLGVEEVYGHLERHRALAPEAIVERSLALHYPFARLFFVARANTELADALGSGLKRAFADGSFQRLLENHVSVKRSLAQAALSKRVIIELDNPLLTPAFKQMPAAYFYRPK